MEVLAAILAISICDKSLPFGRHQFCDLIELNHFHDSRGCEVFQQVILWERQPENGKMAVRQWYLVQSDDSKVPTKADSGLYHARWDGIHVVSRLYRESWTQRDPEFENRKVWPVENRVCFAKEVTK